MKITYKIRSRKEPSGSTFYQLTIPREWIEQTRATEIQFKNGENNQLIIVPVAFSDSISVEQQDSSKPKLKPDRTVDERMEDLFFGNDIENKSEGYLENLDLVDEANKKYKNKK